MSRLFRTLLAVPLAALLLSGCVVYETGPHWHPHPYWGGGGHYYYR